MIIESLTNKKIKEVVKLKNKNNRDSKNKFIIETKNLIEEAIKNKLDIPENSLPLQNCQGHPSGLKASSQPLTGIRPGE